MRASSIGQIKATVRILPSGQKAICTHLAIKTIIQAVNYLVVTSFLSKLCFFKDLTLNKSAINEIFQIF